MHAQQEVIYTHAELQERLTYWQDKLRLRDWIIFLKVKRARDMSLEGVSAMVTWMDDSKQAQISILDPLDYPEDCWTPQDMEWSLVHELLHLQLVTVTDKDDVRNSTDIEQIIESITYGLITLERQAHPLQTNAAAPTV